MNDSANKIQNGAFLPRKRHEYRLLWSMLLGVMTLFDASAAYALPTFVVNSTRDAVDATPGDGLCATTNTNVHECTLRAAIMELSALNFSSTGFGTVVLASGVTYTLTTKGPNEDDGRSGDLDVKMPMTIKSSGAGAAIVRGSSGWNDRIFHIKTFLFDFSVTVVGIEIQNGHPDGLGGGILIEDSRVQLTNSTVSANFSLSGGGIAIRGTVRDSVLVLDSSTVSGNTAEAKNGTKGGTSGDGGGIWTSGLGAFAFVNSTISGNKGMGNGGGIFLSAPLGSLNANNVTIAKNVADSDSDAIGDGGGIFVAAGTVRLANTIVAGNLDLSTTTNRADCAGTISSLGFNLVQNATGCILAGATTGNITGRDPLLGSLQNNGGPTFTHALQKGVIAQFFSPAIDVGSTATSGDSACLLKDQRGVTRPLDGNGDFIVRCDIGAFEAPPPSSSLGLPSLEPVETSIYPAEHVIYNFAWTVPGPSWRVLDNLQLRIRDEQGVAFWVYFQQVAGSQGTFSLMR